MKDRQQITLDRVLRSETDYRALASLWRDMLAQIDRPARRLGGIALLSVGEVSAQLLLALIGKRALDRAVGGLQPVVPPEIIGLALVALGGVFWLVRARRLAIEQAAAAGRERASQRLARNINRARYQDLAAVPMAALREILMTDVPAVFRFLCEWLSLGVILTFWSLAAVIALGVLAPPLLLVLALLALVCVAVFGLMLWRHLPIEKRKFLALAELSDRARELVELERLILARQFGLKDYFEHRFQAALQGFLSAWLEHVHHHGNLLSLVMTLNASVFLAVIAAGGALVSAGTLTAGVLVALLFVMNQLLAVLNQAATLAGRSPEAIHGTKRLAAYWHSDDAVEKPSVAQPDNRSEPIDRVEATELTFTYGAEPVLERVSVNLVRGHPATLTAETGAGKSTLGLLLTGVLEASTGRVRLNGKLPPTAFAPGRVLYVGPKPVLFPGSVRDNLLLSDPSALETCPAARTVLSFLRRGGRQLSVDADLLGSHGSGLSAGQAQIVQLARAVLRNPDFVVLDESTCSLDMPTEASLQEALLPWLRERISLVISHRECPWTTHAEERLTLKDRHRLEKLPARDTATAASQ